MHVKRKELSDGIHRMRACPVEVCAYDNVAVLCRNPPQGEVAKHIHEVGVACGQDNARLRDAAFTVAVAALTTRCVLAMDGSTAVRVTSAARGHCGGARGKAFLAKREACMSDA
jgi:hypothetical protein